MDPLKPTEPVREAEKYISDSVATFQDVSEIAWRFLLGNRILEYMNNMLGLPKKGEDFKVLQSNENYHILKLGDYIISINLDEAPKLDGRQEPLNQPNLPNEMEDLGH